MKTPFYRYALVGMFFLVNVVFGLLQCTNKGSGWWLLPVWLITISCLSYMIVKEMRK
jgi:hypothetical protein